MIPSDTKDWIKAKELWSRRVRCYSCTHYTPSMFHHIQGRIFPSNPVLQFCIQTQLATLCKLELAVARDLLEQTEQCSDVEFKSELGIPKV